MPTRKLPDETVIPLDDEPYSAAERREDDVAREELARGERITLDEVKREFGL